MRLNFKLKQRLLLVFSVVFLGTGFLATQLYSALNRDLVFTQQQLRGTSYIMTVIRLLNELTNYQATHLRSQADPSSAASKLQQGQHKIEALFVALHALDQQHAKALKLFVADNHKRFTPMMATAKLEASWKAIKDAPYQHMPYKVLRKNLGALMDYLGNGSNLILDPDLDSYYLVDVIFTTFIPLVNKLSELTIVSMNTLQGPLPMFLPSQYEYLDGTGAVLKDAFLSKIEKELTISLDEDGIFYGISPSLHQNIPTALTAYRRHIDRTSELLQSLAEPHPQDPDAVFTALKLVNDGTVELASVVVQELKALLDIRLKSLSKTLWTTLLSCLSLTVAGLGLATWLIQQLSQAMLELGKTMRHIIDGKENVEIPYSDHQDEVGDMARSVGVLRSHVLESAKLKQAQELLKQQHENDQKKTMLEVLKHFESRVQGLIQEVSASSAELYGTAQKMQEKIILSADKSATIVTSSNMALDHAHHLSEASMRMQEASKNIAQHAEQSQKAVRHATEATAKANATSQLLNEATLRVGEIIDLIQNMAEQINLLALNATIESARAGDAGKGFAVVASEVKQLASQTTNATTDIAASIGNIRHVVTDVVKAMESIQLAVTELSSISSGLTETVAQQTTTTASLDQSMQGTLASTAQIQKASQEVQLSANEAIPSAEMTYKGARALSERAGILATSVTQFLEDMRAKYQ